MQVLAALLGTARQHALSSETSPVAALLPARVPWAPGVTTVSMDMDTQGAPFDSLDGGPRDSGVAMVDEDDSADSGGSVVAMDEEEDPEEEDPMEDETPPRKLVRQESSAVLPDEVFAAAHTGDRRAVSPSSPAATSTRGRACPPPRAATVARTQALT